MFLAGKIDLWAKPKPVTPRKTKKMPQRKTQLPIPEEIPQYLKIPGFLRVLGWGDTTCSKCHERKGCVVAYEDEDSFEEKEKKVKHPSDCIPCDPDNPSPSCDKILEPVHKKSQLAKEKKIQGANVDTVRQEDEDSSDKENIPLQKKQKPAPKPKGITPAVQASIII
jgi:hypothetical protein